MKESCRQLDDLDNNGYLTCDELVDKRLVRQCRLEICQSNIEQTRTLLNHSWAQRVVHALRGRNDTVGDLLSDLVAIQCTLFCKSIESNWSVRPHRDFVFPVANVFQANGWQGWTVKEGIDFARPPQVILNKLLAVRINLSDDAATGGSLAVIPGTHLMTTADHEAPVEHSMKQGGVLIFRPLLLHTSRKVHTGSRIVLHYVFGPRELSPAVPWKWVV